MAGTSKGRKSRSIRNQMAVMENSKRQDGKKDRSKIVKTFEPLDEIVGTKDVRRGSRRHLGKLQP